MSFDSGFAPHLQWRVRTGFSPVSLLAGFHRNINIFISFLDFFAFGFFAFRPFCFWTFVFSLLLFVLILTLSITIVYFVSYVFLHFYKSLTVFQDFLIENHIKSGFLTLSVLICLSQG